MLVVSRCRRPPASHTCHLARAIPYPCHAQAAAACYAGQREFELLAICRPPAGPRPTVCRCSVPKGRGIYKNNIHNPQSGTKTQAAATSPRTHEQAEGSKTPHIKEGNRSSKRRAGCTLAQKRCSPEKACAAAAAPSPTQANGPPEVRARGRTLATIPAQGINALGSLLAWPPPPPQPRA